MTRCDKCRKEVGPLFCGNCRKEVRKDSEISASNRALIPLLYWNPKTNSYVPACNCTECPYNVDGACVTEYAVFAILTELLHEYDGDNIIHQVCV